MAGWVPTPRELLSDDLWLAETFTRGQARIDLYGLARHTPGHVRLKGVRIDLQRGELAWSEQALATRWRWSRGKVRRFLAELSAERVLVQRPSNLTSIIAMLNYDCQPVSSTADEAPVGASNGTAGRTVNGTQKNKETIKQPPPPTPSLSKGAAHQWREVEGELVDLGMVRAADAVAAAKSRHLSIEDVQSLIAEWRQHEGAWLIGALFQRLTGQLAAWPPVTPAFERQAASVASAAAQESLRVDCDRRRALNSAVQSQAAEHDRVYGPALDAMAEEQLRELFVAVLGEDEWALRCRRGKITSPQRAQLLEAIASQEAVA